MADIGLTKLHILSHCAFIRFELVAWHRSIFTGLVLARLLQVAALTHLVRAELALHVAHVDFLGPYLVVQSSHRSPLRYSLPACL